MSEHTSVDSLIASYPEPRRSIVLGLRALVREIAPHLQEQVKWNHPVYGIGTAGLFSILPHARHVNLQVFNGATLSDHPDRLLEGTGKSMRHVKCRSMTDVERPELRRLMIEAVRLARFDVRYPGAASAGPL